MYALKIVTDEVTSSYELGTEYHIFKRKDDSEWDVSISASVSGEASSDHFAGLYINKNTDAYITNENGKTIEVINRAHWHKE